MEQKYQIFNFIDIFKMKQDIFFKEFNFFFISKIQKIKNRISEIILFVLLISLKIFIKKLFALLYIASLHYFNFMIL